MTNFTPKTEALKALKMGSQCAQDILKKYRGKVPDSETYFLYETWTACEKAIAALTGKDEPMGDWRDTRGILKSYTEPAQPPVKDWMPEKYFVGRYDAKAPSEIYDRDIRREFGMPDDYQWSWYIRADLAGPIEGLRESLENTKEYFFEDQGFAEIKDTNKIYEAARRYLQMQSGGRMNKFLLKCARFFISQTRWKTNLRQTDKADLIKNINDILRYYYL